MASKRGFFARLFGLGRRRDSFKLTVGSVLGRIAQAALARSSGAERQVTAEPINTETLLAEIGEAGWRVSYFRESDPPDLILFISAESLTALAGNAAGESGGFPPLLKQEMETLADFIRPWTAPRGAEALEIPLPHLRYFLKYSTRDTDEIRWRASGSACYRLTVGSEGEGGVHIHACVEYSVDGMAEDSFASDDAYAKAVRAMAEPRKGSVKNAPAAGAGLPLCIDLRAPREFIAGSLFLAPRIPCGKYLLETRFSSAAVLTDRTSYAGTAGIWAHCSWETAGKKWPFRYFFPAQEQGTPAPAEGTFKTIAGCGLKESLPHVSSALGARAENPLMAMDSRPDLDGEAGYVVLKAALSVGPNRFSCHVFLGYELISRLAKTLLDPAEISAAVKGSPSILPLLFGVNAVLFSRRIPDFHAAFIPGGTFPFAAFLDLIPARDRAIALQNYVLRSLGTRGLRSLFSYAEAAQSADGDPVTRVHTPYAIDEAGLLALLPESAREDWRNARRMPLPAEPDHRLLDREMLEGIERSIRKKTLLLSPRSVLVLERFFMPGIRAEADKNLVKTAEEGVPYAAVRRLPKPRIQQFFATRPNRSVALSVLGSESELPFIRAHVSVKRAADLSEDIAYLRAERAAGRIGSGDILSAMRELERAAVKMMEDMEKQTAREKARKAGVVERRGG